MKHEMTDEDHEWLGFPCDGRAELQPEIDRLTARVTELERDNQGWEDECRLFLAQRDAYKEALEDIADQSTHPQPKCPSAWAKGNRARKALGLTPDHRRRKHESEVDIKS